MLLLADDGQGVPTDRTLISYDAATGTSTVLLGRGRQGGTVTSVVPWGTDR